MKTEIVRLCRNAMFKAVFSNNKYMLSRLVQAILDYLQFDINVMDKELVINNNELSLNNVHNRQLVCDYFIKVNDTMELNIEVNRSYYPGVEERNMGYCFKIYGVHFRSGDKYEKFKKYFLVQVNFNNYSNYDDETIKEFYLLDIKNPKNYLTKNVCFINIDIAQCFKLVYNEDKFKEMSTLERFGAIFFTNILEDISYILGSDMINMKEKNKFLEELKEKSTDKEVLASLKFEDSIDYRFNLVEEDALERGSRQGFERGVEQNTIDMIQQMLKNNIDLEKISKISNKTIEEIKKIADLK